MEDRDLGIETRREAVANAAVSDVHSKVLTFSERLSAIDQAAEEMSLFDDSFADFVKELTANAHRIINPLLARLPQTEHPLSDPRLAPTADKAVEDATVWMTEALSVIVRFIASPLRDSLRNIEANPRFALALEAAFPNPDALAEFRGAVDEISRRSRATLFRDEVINQLYAEGWITRVLKEKRIENFHRVALNAGVVNPMGGAPRVVTVVLIFFLGGMIIDIVFFNSTIRRFFSAWASGL